MLKLLWRILNRGRPLYLKEFFTVLRNRESESRSLNMGLLSIPLHKTNFVNNSFLVQCARHWNELPASLRISSSSSHFKLKLHELMENLDM